ncbi:MAG: site-2 protease family protein [Planctomycetes bacterium]|nr:site-2 protease family protein [Planctomycetota bacterium]
MDSSILGNMLVWYLVFLFSTTMHEAAHSLISSYGGDDTAYRAGQVSLNPVPHIRREPIGMVVVPILTFILNSGSWMIGWASAPFNPFWAARYPRRSFLMSLAGPLSHLIPIIIAWVGLVIGLRTGYFVLEYDAVRLIVGREGDGLAGAVAYLLWVALQLNVVLLVFNLLPIPPLDGSELWYLFVKSEEGRLRLRSALGQYGLAGILLAWWAFGKIFPHVWIFVLIRLLRFGVGFF